MGDLGGRFADQPNSVTTAGQSSRIFNPFNTLRRFWFSAGLALCCGPRQVDPDMLVVLLFVRPTAGAVAAMKNGTLLDPEARAEILRRIEALTPRSERRWGRMTPHQMVCHLSDACRAALGERRVPVIGTLWERTGIRWLATHTNVKWPQGVRTVPEADQEIGGTRPTEFARDVDELRGLIERFSGPETQLSGDHPLFGALSAAEWGRFSYRHADHHLRQFGA